MAGGSAGGGRRKLARVPFDGLFVDADDVAEVVEGVIAITCVLRFPVPASLRAVVDRGAGKYAVVHFFRLILFAEDPAVGHIEPVPPRLFQHRHMVDGEEVLDAEIVADVLGHPLVDGGIELDGEVGLLLVGRDFHPLAPFAPVVELDAADGPLYGGDDERFCLFERGGIQPVDGLDDAPGLPRGEFSAAVPSSS